MDRVRIKPKKISPPRRIGMSQTGSSSFPLFSGNQVVLHIVVTFCQQPRGRDSIRGISGRLCRLWKGITESRELNQNRVIPWNKTYPTFICSCPKKKTGVSDISSPGKTVLTNSINCCKAFSFSVYLSFERCLAFSLEIGKVRFH